MQLVRPTPLPLQGCGAIGSGAPLQGIGQVPDAPHCPVICHAWQAGGVFYRSSLCRKTIPVDEDRRIHSMPLARNRLKGSRLYCNAHRSPNLASAAMQIIGMEGRSPGAQKTVVTSPRPRQQFGLSGRASLETDHTPIPHIMLT